MTQTQTHCLISLGAISFSIGGIVLAVYRPEIDGNWGGALTFIFGIWSAYASPSHGKEARNNYLELAAEDNTLDLPMLIKGLLLQDKTDEDSQRKRNLASAIVLSFGSLSAAFGEVLSNFIRSIYLPGA